MASNKQNRIVVASLLSACFLALPGTAQGEPQFAPCPEPVAYCVKSNYGWCEINNGKITIHFWDRFKPAITWYRRCVFEALAKRGHQSNKTVPKR